MTRPIPVAKVGEKQPVTNALVAGGLLVVGFFLFRQYGEELYRFGRQLGIPEVFIPVLFFFIIALLIRLISRITQQNFSETIQVHPQNVVITPPSKSVGTAPEVLNREGITSIRFTRLMRQQHSHQKTQHHTYYQVEVITNNPEPGKEYKYEIGNAVMAKMLYTILVKAGYNVEGDMISVKGYVIKIIGLVLGLLFLVFGLLA